MDGRELPFIIPVTERRKRGRYSKRGPVPQTAPTLARIRVREILGHNMTQERRKLGVPLESENEE